MTCPALEPHLASDRSAKSRVAEWFHATEEEIKEYGGNELAERLSRSVDGIYPAE